MEPTTFAVGDKIVTREKAPYYNEDHTLAGYAPLRGSVDSIRIRGIDGGQMCMCFIAGHGVVGLRAEEIELDTTV